MTTYRTRSGAIYTTKHPHSKYRPHFGAKESAKFAKRNPPEHVPCEGCGEYGEPNFAGGKRYCGRQYCCP